MDEEDEERAVLLQEILDLLLAGGYFRARISSLAPFDKLTGGLAWCITASNEDVDFDMFFDDDATLGDKIKVGEAIEGALQRMGCPHPLQAHQIQGLDYQAVYPVVQWLVKRVSATREALGDQLRRYSHLRFQENYEFCEDAELRQRRMERLKVVGQSLPQQRVRRIYRPAKTTPVQSDITDRASCTMLEYGHVLTRPIAVVNEEEPPFSFPSLPIVTTGDTGQLSSLDDSLFSIREGSFFTLPSSMECSLASSKVEHIMELRSKENHVVGLKYSPIAEVTMAHQKQVHYLSKQIDLQEEKNNQLKEQIKGDKLLVERLQESKKQQGERSVGVQAELDRLQNRVDETGASDIVSKLYSHLEQLKSLEKQELDFHLSCKKKHAERKGLIQQLENQASNFTETDKYQAEVDNAFAADLQKLKSLREELAKTNQKAVVLQRKVDEIPTQPELMQYERCFVELYLHIQGKLRETRKYYATYNALAEANELTTKEISLLNSINLQFEKAMLTAEGRAKFVESLGSIVKGVQKKLEKMGARFGAEQTELTALKEKHGTAVAAQRHYVTLMKLFQDECARNEKLQSALKANSEAN